MSELGNRIKSIRASESQLGFAKKAGLSLRTICKLEAGESVRLATIRQIAEALNLLEIERLDLIVLWLKLELGEDYKKLNIEPKSGSSSLKDADHLLGRLQLFLNEVPRKYQEQICLAVQRPEILRCLQSLNDLYDSVKAEP